MDTLRLSKFELHIIMICYLEDIKLHPTDDVPSQERREAIAEKLAAFLGQLPADAKLILLREE